MKFISEDAASKATPNKVIEYVFDEEKVCKDENGEVIMATIGLDDDRSYAEQFRETALLYGNSYDDDERKYYHTKYTVSPRDFNPDRNIKNITPEQLRDETVQFCLDNLPGYQCLIVIQNHDNRKSDKNLDPSSGRWVDERFPNEKHLHAHIITNACPYDLELGMLRLRNKDLDAMRDYAYEAGKKYKLNERNWREEVAEKRARQKDAQKQKEASQEDDGINHSAGEKVIIERHGAAFASKSFKERYRIAIDEGCQEVTNFEAFKDYLREEFSIRTEVTQQGNIKFKLPDRTTFTSGKVLGENYTLDSIMAALERSKEAHKDDFAVPSAQHKDAPVLSIESIRWRNKIVGELKNYRDWEEEMRAQDPSWKTDSMDSIAMANRERLIREKTAEFHRLYQQAANNETLKAALAADEKEEIEELLRYLNLLKMEREKRQQELVRIRVRYTVTYRVYYPRYLGRYDEYGRERSIAELIFILAKVMLENKFGPMEPPEYDYSNNVIQAQTDWKMQNLLNATRIARELGTSSMAEMELAVKKEGRKLGEAKQEYFDKKRECEKAIAVATGEIQADETLSADERKQKILEVQEREMQKLEPLEKIYRAAKKKYKEYVRAVDELRWEQNRFAYQSDIEAIKKQMEKEKESQQEDVSPNVPQQEQPRRSKAEAKREEEKQWQDIRDWSDMAIEAIANKPDVNADWNLREWAKEMEKQGCVVRITKQTISVTHPDSNQPVRMNRLGGAYEKEYIVNGISNRKQEYREEVEADHRRAEAERDAAADRAYGKVVRRAAAGIEDHRTEGYDDRGNEAEAGRSNKAERGSDPAGRTPEEVLQQRGKDGRNRRKDDGFGEL